MARGLFLFLLPHVLPHRVPRGESKALPMSQAGERKIKAGTSPGQNIVGLSGVPAPSLPYSMHWDTFSVKTSQRKGQRNWALEELA